MRGSAVVGRSRAVHQGRSTSNEAFDLDVSADGTSVVNLRTGQIKVAWKTASPPLPATPGHYEGLEAVGDGTLLGPAPGAG